MPALTMSETEDCQRRFQAAVDVIQNLPKNGSYKPSYEVMLRFYGLYKQAVCGPCTVSRPGFWDPVGRYKWDAWNRLGDMSCEKAMAAYVDEMKKVAQEVIDTMPVNEKTASFFHYFEPLYHVIHDMPRPPEALLTLRSDVITKELTDGLPQHDVERATQELISEEQDVIETVPDSEHHLETTALSDGQVLTSDSESEIFCDSLEQLDTVKGSGQSATNSGMKRRLFTIQSIPDGSNQLPGMPDSLQNWHIDMEKRVQEYQYTPVSQVTQVGAGHGGEGAEDRRGPPMRRRNTGREGMQQGWRGPSGYMAHRYGRWAERPASGAGSGGGGGDDGHDRLQDAQVQQQIILALRQLREDMQSVMERLEVVEGLATANAQNFQWRSHLQMTASETEEKWWPFDISGRTLLLLLVWPLVAQGLVFLLRRRKRKFHVSI